MVDDEDVVTQYAPYSLIYCNQVLEHVPDPVGVVRMFAQWLKPGGLLFVSVPANREGLADVKSLHVLGRSLPKDINPWEHLNYFTPRSLSAILREAGFLLLEQGFSGERWVLEPIEREPTTTSLVCRYTAHDQQRRRMDANRVEKEWRIALQCMRNNAPDDDILQNFGLATLTRHAIRRIYRKMVK